MTSNLPLTASRPVPSGNLTAVQFQQLAEVPPAITWFANIDNPRTRRAYESDLREFMAFTGIEDPTQFRSVSRGHVLAWRRDLEQRDLSPATIRRKLAALSSLFDYLCESHAVTGNPVEGVKRPRMDSGEGKTPAIGDHQARALLDVADTYTLRGKRDRAILATLLYHGLRRAELCGLRVGDIQERRGVKHLQVHGKGSKIRYIPLHPGAAGAIATYLEFAGHGDDVNSALFRSISNNARSRAASITPDGVYKMLASYAKALQIDIAGFGPHALRATAATNALDNGADIAKVQEWLGHANIATTRVYDRRQSRPEDSPKFKVTY